MVKFGVQGGRIVHVHHVDDAVGIDDVGRDREGAEPRRFGRGRAVE